MAWCSLDSSILHKHHQSDSTHHIGLDVHPLHLSLLSPTSLWLFHSFNLIITHGSYSQGVRQKQFNWVRTGLAGDCPTTVTWSVPSLEPGTLPFPVTHKLCPTLTEEWVWGFSCTNNIFRRSLGNINLKTPYIWSTKRGLSISSTYCASLLTWRRTSSVFIPSQMSTKNTLTSSELPEFCSQ